MRRGYVHATIHSHFIDGLRMDCVVPTTDGEWQPATELQNKLTILNIVAHHAANEEPLNEHYVHDHD